MAPLPWIRVSLDRLPPEIDESERAELWHDHYSRMFAFDSAFLVDRPPSVDVAFTQSGHVRLISVQGTLSEISRTPRHVLSDPQADLCITFNRGSPGWMLRQCDREMTPATNAASFHTNGEPYTFHAKTGSSWIGVGIDRSRLAPLVAHPDDLVAKPFDTNSAAMRHLGRYLSLVMAPDGAGEDEALDEHIGATLLDLVALALGAGRDSGEMARMRGQRAARLRETLAEIRQGFVDPAFSPRRVAAKLGVSPRYVQELLHETGRSFSERVMELRLQKARRMLERGHDLKVIEIASVCGFNEVSYFNRCFRRRFGVTPNGARNGSRSV